jgi:dTDP-4-dehydrorhamnose 3,5-epimerase
VVVRVRQLAIEGVLEIIPDRFGDNRGFFSETYSRFAFEGAGLRHDWVQDNHSYSATAGVLRGLHYQAPPFAQDKLVRVVRGSIFDVAVDIRTGSPTFGKWVSLVVSAEAWNQLLVPKGFAHGFLTLEPNVEVIYKISAPYSAAHDRNIRYDDADIGVKWPLSGRQPVLSEKDLKAPALMTVNSGFRYGEEGS